MPPLVNGTVIVAIIVLLMIMGLYRENSELKLDKQNELIGEVLLLKDKNRQLNNYINLMATPTPVYKEPTIINPPTITYSFTIINFIAAILIICIILMCGYIALEIYKKKIRKDAYHTINKFLDEKYNTKQIPYKIYKE